MKHLRLGDKTMAALGGLFIMVLIAYYFAEAKVRADFEQISESEKIYFLPNKQLAPILSLGYEHFFAELQLLEAQIFFHDHSRSGSEEDREKFKAMIELVLTLDPQCTVAATFANFALSQRWDLMGVADGNELLEMAWRKNPDKYKLPMYIAFNYYLFGDNPNQVVKWMRIALDNPEAPRRLIWVVNSALNSGANRDITNYSVYCDLCEQAADPAQRDIFCTKCLLYKYILGLDELRQRFEQREGKKLENVRELVAKGYLEELPPDPLGGEWVIRPDGRIDSSANESPTNSIR